MNFDYRPDTNLARLIEEGAEELGRLDSIVAMAPAAVPLLLQSAAAARLATAHPQATRQGYCALVASSVEVVHAAALDESLRGWQERLEDGERRARSGVPLAVPAHLALGEAERALLMDALKPGGQPRSVILRAVCAAGVIEAAKSASNADAASNTARTSHSAPTSHAVPTSHAENSPDAELTAALLLTAAGTTDRVRLLPFAEFSGSARSDAREAWLAGDGEPFVRGALSALAPAARRLRLQVRLLLDARVDEDDHLSTIGRAAVTARRALQVLRDSLATSVPDLANRLESSRPAAGDALERLAELGLAEEITGRGRDRVWVWAAAWGLS